MLNQHSNKKFKPFYFIILLLTLISYQIISDRTIFPNVPKRIEIQNSILSGQIEAPYQYRILKPVLGYSLQKVISLVVKNPLKVHTLSYQLIIFLAFLGIYSLFYTYLKNFFSETACILGLVLLQVVIPLGITSIWEEGDYYTLLLYLVGLNFIFKSKDFYLPIIIAIGVLNRSQIIFIVIFYMAYLFEQRKLFNKKSIFVIILCFAAFFVVFYALRFYFGFKEISYPINHEITTNINQWFLILILWTEEVFIFIILSILAFKKSRLFFKLSFLSLIVYVIFFFFNSIMTQLAKFLPAYLIMIPMSLQILTGESTKKEQISISQS